MSRYKNKVHVFPFDIRLFYRYHSRGWGSKFCTEHDSDTVAHCAKWQNNLITDQQAMGKRDFTRFGFKMRFGRISYIAQPPWFISLPLRQSYGSHIPPMPMKKHKRPQCVIRKLSFVGFRNQMSFWNTINIAISGEPPFINNVPCTVLVYQSWSMECPFTENPKRDSNVAVIHSQIPWERLWTSRCMIFHVRNSTSDKNILVSRNPTETKP